MIVFALWFVILTTVVSVSLTTNLRRIADAIEAQNGHYGIGQPDESGTTGAEEHS